MKAKSDIDFEKLVLSGTFKGMKKWETYLPPMINGFDTEVADGKLFMISYAYDKFEDFGGRIMTGSELTEDNILNLLSNYKCRNCHNMWYNLNYDVGVLLSHILTKRELQILKYVNQVTFERNGKGYRIMYIPGKFMSVKEGNISLNDMGDITEFETTNVCTHYDASQFFYQSLNTAAQEWLNMEKIDEVDTSKFGLNEDNTLNAYITDNWDIIKEYAIRDAELTRDLWYAFCKTAVEYDIPVEKPFSTGFMAQTYYENTADKKPGFKSNDMQKLAFESYAGGRFEIFKRGTFNQVCGFDINSAYPYEMTKLPDPDSCDFHFIDNPELEDLEGFNLGIIDLTVTNNDGIIQPFTIKDKVRVFPKLRQYRLTVTLPELHMAIRYNMIKNMELHQAILAKPAPNANYPFKFLSDLYAVRRERKSEGKHLQQKVLKIILNSLYGKFIQTTPKRHIGTYDENGEYEFTEKERALLSIHLPTEIEDLLIIERLETGKLFNPFIASHICANTRVHLVDFVMQNNLVDKTIMFATDCVMLEGKPPSLPGWLETDNMTYKEALGKWSLDYEGEGFVVAPGVYQVHNGTKDKLKTRGFHERFIDFDLREHIKNNGGNIEVKRPMSMALAVHQGKPIADIGRFTKEPKEISADMDRKRLWFGGDTWGELLSDSFTSNPLITKG